MKYVIMLFASALLFVQSALPVQAQPVAQAGKFIFNRGLAAGKGVWEFSVGNLVKKPFASGASYIEGQALLQTSLKNFERYNLRLNEMLAKTSQLVVVRPTVVNVKGVEVLQPGAEELMFDPRAFLRKMEASYQVTYYKDMLGETFPVVRGSNSAVLFNGASALHEMTPNMYFVYSSQKNMFIPVEEAAFLSQYTRIRPATREIPFGSERGGSYSAYSPSVESYVVPEQPFPHSHGPLDEANKRFLAGQAQKANEVLQNTLLPIKKTMPIFPAVPVRTSGVTYEVPFGSESGGRLWTGSGVPRQPRSIYEDILQREIPFPHSGRADYLNPLPF